MGRPAIRSGEKVGEVSKLRPKYKYTVTILGFGSHATGPILTRVREKKKSVLTLKEAKSFIREETGFAGHFDEWSAKHPIWWTDVWRSVRKLFHLAVVVREIARCPSNKREECGFANGSCVWCGRPG